MAAPSLCAPQQPRDPRLGLPPPAPGSGQAILCGSWDRSPSRLTIVFSRPLDTTKPNSTIISLVILPPPFSSFTPLPKGVGAPPAGAGLTRRPPCPAVRGGGRPRPAPPLSAGGGRRLKPFFCFPVAFAEVRGSPSLGFTCLFSAGRAWAFSVTGSRRRSLGQDVAGCLGPVCGCRWRKAVAFCLPLAALRSPTVTAAPPYSAQNCLL